MFSSRDLMVGLSGRGRAVGPWCPWNSCAWTECLGCTGSASVVCGSCTLNVTCGPCTEGYTNCHPAVSDLTHRGCSGAGPVELNALRGELERALREVDAHERALAEQLKPQTREQVDELERQLRQALDELHTRRAEIEAEDQT
jgi:hypothetical protein